MTSTQARARPSALVKPALRLERELMRSHSAVVAGVDEVGRGALAGPVTVGVVAVTVTTRTAPQGLRDSKLLTPSARDRLAPRIRRWASGHGVGHASAVEIDEIGIIAALRRAGRRALAQLPEPPDVVLLDGNHDWLSDPAAPMQTESLFAQDCSPPLPHPPCPPVRALIKADQRCSSVAAASVLAKTTRDAMMRDYARDYPGYQWQVNKGYAAPEHLGALRRLGPTALHRTSWRLPAPNAPAETLPGFDILGSGCAGVGP